MSAAADAIPTGRTLGQRVSDLERELTQTEDTGERLQAFATLAVTEALLASEHREWLRLMIDAEWI